MFKGFADILNDLFSYIGDSGGKISDFNVGSALRTILEAVAALAEEIWYNIQFFVNLFFLDTSKGDWLDKRLNDLGMERKDGSSAYGTITVGRDSPSQISVKIAAGTTFQDDTGELIFTTLADAVLNIGDSSVDVISQATDVGTAYNLASGTILKQSGVAISGIEWVKIKLMGGGEDIESDEDFKARVPAYFDSLSRGTAPALKYAAEEVDGVESVELKENYPSKGWFTLYVDDGSGVANDTLLQSVRAKLEDYRAFTVMYVVDTAKLLSFSCQLQLTISDAAANTADAIRSSVQTAIITYVNALKMGQALNLADLIYLARNVDGVENLKIISPTADITSESDQLLRTTSDKVVIS